MLAHVRQINFASDCWFYHARYIPSAGNKKMMFNRLAVHIGAISRKQLLGACNFRTAMEILSSAEKKGKQLDADEQPDHTQAAASDIRRKCSLDHMMSDGEDIPERELHMSVEGGLHAINSPPSSYLNVDAYTDFEMVDREEDAPLGEGMIRGCLVLCCFECIAVTMVQFSCGYVPPSIGLPTTSRSNALCLTCCKKCHLRTQYRSRGEKGNRGGSWTKMRNIGFISSLWNDLDVTQAATLVLGEDVAFATDGVFARYLSWSDVSNQTDRLDQVVSLDIGRLDGGESDQIILPHLGANWI